MRLLEDRDDDGRYEQATVFASGLNFPNGVLAARGGVFVTAAPDILFLRDTDGDGQADERRVVLTGFAEGNQQLRANGLTWGLDNWIYGANGRCDGDVRRPADPPDKAVSMAGRDFRFRPDGSAFEAVSGQSQFGQASRRLGQPLHLLEHDPDSTRAVRPGVHRPRPAAGRRSGARYRRAGGNRAASIRSAPARKPSTASAPTITTPCAG